MLIAAAKSDESSNIDQLKWLLTGAVPENFGGGGEISN